MSDIRTVTVLGTGVLGSQIAFQTAFHGFDVVAYDISDEILEKAKERFAKLAAAYRAEVEGASDETIEATLGRIRLTSDLADAVKDADLVIEAVPEITKIKVETYEKLAKLAAAEQLRKHGLVERESGSPTFGKRAITLIEKRAHVAEHHALREGRGRGRLDFDNAH